MTAVLDIGVDCQAKPRGERPGRDATNAAALAQHGVALQAVLAGGGWAVDEVAYETKLSAVVSGVARSVVEHVISQDSLNRLI